jgi:hypothetical protein
MSNEVNKDRPCPFCGGNELSPGYWSLDDEEVDSIECDNCYAGAPKRVWNQRDGFFNHKQLEK